MEHSLWQRPLFRDLLDFSIYLPMAAFRERFGIIFGLVVFFILIHHQLLYLKFSEPNNNSRFSL